MAIRNVLLALDAGLGHGETCIFPIHIFKVKEGVNYNPGDPNYDLFRLSCKVSARRLFPNYVFLDAPSTCSIISPAIPETEVATMGCRTRVMGNVYDPTRQIAYSRGNLSFTSINLPRLAIESHGDEAVFYQKLDAMLVLVAQQLLDRFEIQASKHVHNFPFLMGQGIWLDSDKLTTQDDLREVLKHGTLSIGFIGLAETLTALYGAPPRRERGDAAQGAGDCGPYAPSSATKSQEMKMNFTLLATPAEGLSGRFVRMDQKRYGKIPGVTDREYYTNSFHIPVWFPISAYDKIRLEAPITPCATRATSAMWSWTGTPPRTWRPLRRWCAGCTTPAWATAASTTRWTGTRSAAMWGHRRRLPPVRPPGGGDDSPEKIDQLKKQYPEMPAFQGIR